MIIPLDELFIKELHEYIRYYYKIRGIEDIPAGYTSEGLIKGSIELASQDKLYGKEIYPHPLQQAAVLLHSLISFHPFTEANKRTALLATYYYLQFNGYDFIIPKDSEAFTLRIAEFKEYVSYTEVLAWLIKNTKRTITTIIMNALLKLLYDENNPHATCHIGLRFLPLRVTRLELLTH